MMMPASQTMMPRPRSSDTLKTRLPTRSHTGSLGLCSGSICVAWLLLAVCILVVLGGTSAMPATAVERHETAAVDLGALLDAGYGAIVTVVAGNTRLAVHRAVLAARSQVFAEMLAHYQLEASFQEFVIPDVDGPELRNLVTFLYSGKAPQPPAMTPQLLEAAQKYGVSGLRDAFEQQLASHLTVDNAAAQAVLAVTHNYPTLRQAAIAFIRDHAFLVMATPGWAEAVHSYPEAVVDFTRLLVNPPTETRAPATDGSEATTTTRPHSDDGHTHVAATPFPTCSSTVPLDDEAVSRLRGLSDDEKGRRLAQAAKEGALEEVRALLAAGADVGARVESEWTALHHAAALGRVEAARCLLEAGAEVNARLAGKTTPLHWAAGRGRTAVVRLLLAYSANPYAEDWERRTPLHWAGWDGHVEAATLLLEAGADAGAVDAKRKTPLDLARQQDHQQLVKILEKY